VRGMGWDRQEAAAARHAGVNLAERRCALALRSPVVLTGRSTVTCCFITVCSVTDPAGTARICGDDDEVTTTNFRRAGSSPGQRTTAGNDNEPCLLTNHR
jgi:hypothetical protein